MATKVIVLGSSGMLGSIVTRYLSSGRDLDVTATVRTDKMATACRKLLPKVNWQRFNAGSPDPESALGVIEGNEWVINCIGIIKPLIHDDNAFEVEHAIRINSLLPHLLAKRAEVYGAHVLQIATDCVYSGSKGHYNECDLHDALDVYGKSKSLGEVHSPNVHHLRCSIIGPEWKESKSLLEWFLGQPRGSSVGGYTNHEWNGIPTLHFGKLCGGIIRRHIVMPHLQHVVPSGTVTKYKLLQIFARNYNREDITINPTEAATVIDRTLSTIDEELNRTIWEAASYATPPTVPEMIEEMASVDARIVLEA